MTEAYPACSGLLQVAGITMQHWKALPDARPIILADLQRLGFGYDLAVEVLDRLRAMRLLGSSGRIEDFKLLLPCARCAARTVDDYQRQVSGSAATGGGTTLHPGSVLDGMSGDEFERTVAKILKAMGWTAELIGGSGDHGADILGQDLNQKRWVIQAKKRANGSVPYSALQEINTAKHLYGADYGAVVSQAPYSAQTLRDAAQLGISLWGRDWLLEGLARVGLS